MSDAAARLEDIPDGGSIGLDADPRTGAFRTMVIRRGGCAYAYRNRCPHRGLPLDFSPGRFLTPDGGHIMCTNHVALFRIEDGVCVDGPCPGARLEPVPVEVQDGMIRLGA